LALSILFVFVIFTLVGGSVRFLSFFAPFLAMILALGISDFYQRFISTEGKFNIRFYFSTSLIILIFALELIFCLNTNILNQPFGQAGKHYSVNRWENFGFNQLEDYLTKQADVKWQPIKINAIDDLTIDLEKTAIQSMYIYDGNLRWFSCFWYFRRYLFYSKELFLPTYDLLDYLSEQSLFDLIKSTNVKYAYFIRGIDDRVLDANNRGYNKRQISDSFEEEFKQKNPEVSLVNDINGQPAFRVYKVRMY
jgi:hypothetical protein